MSLDVLDNLFLASDISHHFPPIYLYKIADHCQRKASPSDLLFFRFYDTELSLLNSCLTNQPWDSLVSESDFNRHFDFFYDLVKDGSLEVCHQNPTPHTFKKIIPLDPYKLQKEILYVEAVKDFIICSSSSTVQGL